MRSTTTEARRLRSRRAPSDLLADLARIVDSSVTDHPGHLLVHVLEPPGAVDLAVHPVEAGVHPFDVVAGLTAPPEWWAFGIRARGRAHHLDQPGGAAEPTVVTFLTARDASEASVVRLGDRETLEPPGPALGTIADLCRRVLDLPTAPATVSTSHLFTTRWLDRTMAAWGDPHQRRTLSTSWTAVAALHPAAAARGLDAAELADHDALVSHARAHAEAWPWEALRHAPHTVPLPDGPVEPDVAAWMDDGFFARWTIGAFPPATELAGELRALLGVPLGDTLVATVARLLE